MTTRETFGNENIPSGLMGRSTILYAIVSLTAIVCAWIAFETTTEKHLYGADSWQYFNLARNLVERRVFSLENHGPGVPNYPTMARMPGYPVVLAAIRVVFGGSPWNGAIFNLGCHLVTCLAITRIASRSLGFYPALFAGILCATHVPSLYQATSLMSEASANLVIISMLGLYGMLRSAIGLKPLIFTGLLTGLASLYREPVLAILACGMIVFGIDPKSGIRAIVKKGAVILVFAALVYSPWIVRNFRVSGRFVPLTIFADGGAIGIRKLQAIGELDVIAGNKFWNSYLASEQLIVDMIAKEIGYDYSIIFRPLLNNDPPRRHIGNFPVLLDPSRYFPGRLFETLANDTNLAPTIKIELLYTQLCRNFNESIVVPFDPARIVELWFRRLAYLYSTHDVSPYQSWKYGQWTHRAVQFRWYLVECPLILVGLIACSKKRQMQPYMLFVVLYSLLVLFTMHIEPRYGLLPIMYLKMFAAYGICVVARTGARFFSKSQAACGIDVDSDPRPR